MKTKTFRLQTNDASVWRSVVDCNEYCVKEQFSGTEVVIDIGTHIGSFAYLVLTRGVGEVWCYEPDAGNFALATSNLAEFGGRVHLLHQAVCRSDNPPSELYFSGYEAWVDRWNTGGGDVLWARKGQMVEPVPFDKVIEAVSQQGMRRISLLKLDCEGSEYPILLTSSRLDLVDEIVAEYHELDATKAASLAIDGYQSLGKKELTAFLETRGFQCRTGMYQGIYGKLFAFRRDGQPIHCGKGT